jgi:hypothetical protein
MDEELIDLLEGRIPPMDIPKHAGQVFPVVVTMVDGSTMTTNIYQVGRDLYVDAGMGSGNLPLLTWLKSGTVAEFTILAAREREQVPEASYE